MLLLTRDTAYAYLNKVVVSEVTTNVRGLPVEVPLGQRENLRRRSVANLDNIQVVPKNELIARIGALPLSRVAEVKRAVGSSFQWPELKNVT